MGFLGVYTAIYDYDPQGENELEIKDGELLYVLEKSDEDDWWKAKKRAAEDEDEPVGLVPNNYVEEAKPIAEAKALYDYSRQTDEEVSFSEDAVLVVYDTSDPDWTLVGVDGDFGFAPSNYIETSDVAPATVPAAPPRAPTSPPAEPESPPVPSPTRQAPQGPAAALASVLGGGAPPPSKAREVASPPLPQRPQQFTPEASDEEEPAPALPARPPSVASPPTQHAAPREEEEPPGILPSPPYNRAVSRGHEDQPGISSPGGFHLYNISEMQSAMGKRKKMPTTLGINLATGSIMVAPARARDGETQEWTADKLQHYSIEGKHVFLEMIKPVRSLDLHAGAKDTAQEIVSALGEISGATKGEGLREIIAAAAGGGQKKGSMLYDFMAQGDDEVTVAVGDEVIILDDTKSEEWWMVRRVKNGKEGVVPSSYVEVTGTVEPPSSNAGINAGRSTVEQNRLEEERLAREAARSDRNGIRGPEVGPGIQLPERGSSLVAKADERRQSQTSKRKSKAERESERPKPDQTKVRLWTDTSGSFKVDAQFLGLTPDGKIHLHKLNGVKIAVPVAKMSIKDIEYVEKLTGVSLDDDKPLADIKKRKSGQAGASIESPKQPEYDWFDFFLQAGVGPHQCERYAQNFNKDSMDEAVLPDITSDVLRTLGLKEGDILRVMKFLDQKYGRTGTLTLLEVVSLTDKCPGGTGNGPAGSLFSGPGGTLRNNTRKGRPSPSHQASDVVDPKAFEQKHETGRPPDGQATPISSAPPPKEKVRSGFDDDAWEVKHAAKPASTSTPAPTTSSAPPASSQPSLSGSMAELSVLSPPLQPTPVPQSAPTPAQPTPPPAAPQQQQPPPQLQQPQQTGANPNFFAQLNAQQPQQTGAQQQFMPPRQRPQPPQNLTTSSVIAPPPRPTSAPQNFTPQNQFTPTPLQPQLTGVPRNAPLQAPQGQSLNDLNQQRFQQQQFPQQPLQPQATGFPSQGPGLGQYPQQMMPQQTGFPQQQFSSFQPGQPFLNGNQTGSPFADPRPGFQSQVSNFSTGYGQTPPPQQPMQTGINSILPPALQPQPTGYQPSPIQAQPTGFQPQQTGINGFGGGFQQQQPPPPVPPLPPMPTQQQTPATLVPQKTGPAPAVRFGVQNEPKKLTPQPTGRRANLAQATPQNPFGF
ncbi:MAG: hypothetical protein Q9227_003630 [Pyrenula ochraceoflavens]